MNHQLRLAIANLKLRIQPESEAEPAGTSELDVRDRQSGVKHISQCLGLRLQWQVHAANQENIFGLSTKTGSLSSPSELHSFLGSKRSVRKF